jgi:amidase/aspartyl-tRNA(Asn)/glutamyl-tRNA(Gln) amidotransferase subunit A
VPAAFCGLFGFRGVPRSPLISDAVPLAPSYDTAGWFTGTARDMRTTTALLAGMRTSERAPRGCYLEMPGVDPEVAAACRKAAAAFTVPADAATSEELVHRFEPSAEVYGVLAGVEAWKFHKKWADRQRERYGPLVRERIDRARSISPAQVAAVESSQASLILVWTRYFLSFDFLAMPSAPFAALAKADCTPANRLRMLSLTAPASLAGLPALAIPVPLASGLTAGIQVIFNDPQSPVVPWVLDRVG